MPPAGPETSRYRTHPDQVSAAEQRERAAQRERAIQELAARQHRAVSLPQLNALGLSASAVRNRVAAGKLQRLHRGVYAIGLAPISLEATYMAAVLACGPKAVLSHRSAADPAAPASSARASTSTARQTWTSVTPRRYAASPAPPSPAPSSTSQRPSTDRHWNGQSSKPTS